MSSPIRRILIVDDHDAVRRGVHNLVESKANFEVVGEAADGRLALDMAREVNPDIAILDYSLPGLNGLDLASQLKRALPRIEILIYTMHDREEFILEALQAGVRGFVLKSDTEKHLLAALDALAIRRPYFSGAVSETLLERFLDQKPQPSGSSLTHREREIVQLIAEGHTNKEVARVLNISIKTVETHRASAMHKLNLRTTADLVRYAIRNNIVQA
ncbi:MAG TPA: response regulator transcription factor [Sphingomicrobium sp.]|nr:response regulator transcription factor [Sphingomicrobium sp.]